MANLQYISDVIGPRLTGSANLKRANEYTAEKMKSYGLENVHLEPWSIPVGWERGTATIKMIEPDNGKSLSVAAAGWSPGTKGKVIGDVVVVTATTAKELEAYKGKLKNAIVLRSPPANVATITRAESAPILISRVVAVVVVAVVGRHPRRSSRRRCCWRCSSNGAASSARAGNESTCHRAGAGRTASGEYTSSRRHSGCARRSYSRGVEAASAAVVRCNRKSQKCCV